MIRQVAEIFINVITPVFGLVLIGYIARPRLGLEARTLSRFSYFILVPAFVFNVMSTAAVESALAIRMIAYILAVQVACAALGYAVARLLRRPAKMVGAYILIAVFGNVGNFGLPLIEFRLGSEALVAATVYFLAITTSGFVIGVAAATWDSEARHRALSAVLTTPAIVALIPAVLVNWANLTPPLFLSRMAGLLAAAMVPTMLVALGVQLAASRAHFRWDRDVLIASGIRLLGGAVLALLLAAPFGMEGIERGAGIFQASMPAAVLTALIALEHDLLPDFVTATVLFSTIASVVTLTILLAIV